ncbi:hemolysin-III related-domain-containing protein [Elsinoe ampelina]|uniref:Hemolysin-III related-domain-containing protein n=1 Tax=Elsinoe ampelina TaxID=302913 RepID=A0A6A6GMF2_9PEZI|nr:hemolysin-III related-domain-containing protein [Elsinoe ampelina]
MAKDVHATSTTAGFENIPSTPTTPTSVGKPDESAYWPEIASKDTIPGWLRDNDYIINGHPMPTLSYRRSFRLWRCLHMETMNIWTHLVGATGFIATGVGLYTSSSASSVGEPSAGDRFAFGISLTAAAVCFGLSTAFHTLRSHSYNVHHFWGKMDIFGICLLALGGGSSATFYAFYCNRRIQWIYWGLNTAAALGAAFTLFDTGGGGSKMRTLRGGVFSLLAAAAMLPIFHGVGVMGWAEACKQIGVQWYLAEGVSLLLGVGLFVGRLPERLSPGSFDIWGHSHQLFHVAAVVGTAFHVKALSVGYQYRSSVTGC